jgi:hypothetical protein
MDMLTAFRKLSLSLGDYTIGVAIVMVHVVLSARDVRSGPRLWG